MIIKGKVLGVEHVDFSANGNARKRVYVLTDDCQLMSAYTKVDDSQSIALSNAIGKHVQMRTKMIRNKLTIDALQVDDTRDRAQYIEGEFKRLGISDNENIAGSILLNGPNGRTKFLNITAAELAQIKFILK